MKPSEVFTIALPAGRLADESIEFFKNSKFAEISSLPQGRELIIWDKTKTLRILLVRSQDVPTYLLQGGAQAGITGKDVILERQCDLTMPFEFNFGKCRLSVASTEELAEKLLTRRRLIVATKYPNLASNFFYKSGISCEIIKLHGSIEIAPILGLADCIVDLVSTGTTLRENGLIEVCKILDSSAVLVVNRQAYAIHEKRLQEFFLKIKNYQK